MEVDEFLYSDDNEVFAQFKLSQSKFGELLLKELWSLEEAAYIVAGYVPEIGKMKFVLNFDYEIESESCRAGSDVRDLIQKFGQIYNFLLTSTWNNHEEAERYIGMPNSLPPYEVIMYLSNNNFWFPEGFLQKVQSIGMEIYPSVQYGSELFSYYKFIASEEVCSFDDAIHIVMRSFPASLFRDCAKDYSKLNPFVPTREELFGYSNKKVEKVKRKLQLALEDGSVELVEFKKSYENPFMIKIKSLILWANNHYKIHPFLLDALEIKKLKSDAKANISTSIAIVDSNEKKCREWLIEHISSGAPKAPKFSSKGKPNYYEAALKMLPKLGKNQFIRAWEDATKNAPEWGKAGNKATLINSLDELIQSN